MLERFREAVARLLTPPARLLVRLGVGPDIVTWVGTGLVVVIAAVMVPLGWLWQAALLLGLVSFADMLDGQMARVGGTGTRWGAFLDSALDRIGDGAVMGSITVWFALHDQPVWAGVTVTALVLGQVTSYLKARAASEGWTVSGGLAARADRLVIAYLGLLLHGFGVPYALPVAMALLAAASLITVVQRFAQVHRQAVVAPAGPGDSDGAS